MASIHPTKHREKPFWRFILNPDEPISLKLYFDNLTNYAISCALFGVGLILQKEINNILISYSLYAVASICVLFNALQLFVLLLATFQQFIGLSLEEFLSRDEKIKAKVLSKIKLFIWIPIIVVGITYYIFFYFYSKLAP